MAIPETKLEIKVALDDMELGDLPMFDIEQAKENPMAWVNAMRLFLIKYSNWTRAEVDHIKFKELKQIAPIIAEALQVAAVPLAKSSN